MRDSFIKRGLKLKILHTADLHLKNIDDERWKTLQNLIEIGRKEKIDLFIISGDLFDRDIDSEKIRPVIREIFSNNDFKIFIIPGNHDQDSYKSGLFYGRDVILLDDYKSPFEFQDVRLWGLPFERLEEGELLRRLRIMAGGFSSDKVNILLFHGELLDAFYSRTDFGEEGKDRYMPVKLSYFGGMNIGYVLGGHFHRNFEVRTLEGGGYFIYSGSPVSISRKETGRRKVNILTVGEAPAEYPLDSFHYEEVNVELDPFIDRNPVDMVKERLNSTHRAAKILLTVKGHVNCKKIGMDEKKIVQQIDRITDGRCEEKIYEFRDVGHILEDELFKRFILKLKNGNYDREKKERLKAAAIKAMMEAGL